MYTIDNVKIGKHLSVLIEHSEHKSARQFCKAYLQKRNGKENVENDEIQRMQNRISQIINGKKGIQITDLPIFSELLGVSAEDILSAGAALVPASGRKTNYSIAFSKDPSEWEAYIRRSDKLILNPDEYNKTAIDYALEAGNYPFLKYLVENKYIWFVGDDKKDYGYGFGAGTSIKRREHTDLLDLRLKEQDELRFQMIELAVKDEDVDMLDTLHAREIPLLYTLRPSSPFAVEKAALPASENTDRMIEAVAAGKVQILSYFLSPFEIEGNSFVFPYAGRVLDALIRKNRGFEGKLFLEQAIEHNGRIQKKLHALIEESISFCKESFAETYNESVVVPEIMRNYRFNRKAGFISFCKPFYIRPAEGFVSNVVQVSERSKDPELQFLIDELGKSCDGFPLQYKKTEE